MDVIQFLASLLDLHRQQLQALTRQGEIQAEVLAQLLEGEGCGKTPPSGPRERELRMPAMRREEQSPEAYLAVFEQAAASSRLPRGEWGARLATLLSEDVWAETYPAARLSTPDYDALKAKILSQARAVEDQSRLDFLSVRYDPLKGARDLGRRLDSAAKRWLRPQHRTAAQVEQQVAMEQFVSLLPKEAGSWVHRQHPRDLEEAIRLAEQRLSPSNEEDASATGATTVTQTDTSDRESEPGETGRTKRHRNCDQTVVKDNITESFLNKLDTVKLESVNFSLDIPDLEVIYLDEEGMEENPSLKQEVSEPCFPRATERPDREEPAALPQGPLICTQELPEEECADRKWRVRTKNRTSLASVQRTMSPDSAERDEAADSPLLPPRRYGGVAVSSLAPPTPPLPGPALSKLPSAGPQPPGSPVSLPSGVSLSCYQDAMARARLTDRDDSRWRPLLSKLGVKRGVAARKHESSPAPWGREGPHAPGDRAHRCPDCGRSFTQVSSLQEHRNIHTGEKPFRCGECGKAFHHRRTLNKHGRVHSGERPFHCAQCGWTFKLKDALKRHQLTHSRDKPANPDGFHGLSDLRQLTQQLYCEAT